MAILALDYGTKRIGLAISDETLTLARPLPFVDAIPFVKVVARLKELAKAEKVHLIVVGLPRHLDGSYGESAQKVRSFIAQLQRSLTTPIETFDERLTTVQASRQLREAGHDSRDQRSRIDSASAAVILQAYLDRLALRGGLPSDPNEPPSTD